ncbi:uncharacterized protein LOC134656795 isoform X1 [Cydia amplana]|uniref:uncharacterized protein LOC134656795 isoform X1 n=1 Tax=Cydia amplana TaxID=1869771 RepID=UPI002FE52768
MKKRSSVAWRFFDRLEENKRVVGVLCKLCDQQYKYFGNTTNMRTHLTCKHPLQWELVQNGTLDESTLRFTEDTEDSTISVQPRRKYKDKNVRYSVSVDVKNDSNITGEDSMPHIEIQTVDALENESDIEHQEVNEAGIHLVRQMRDSRATDEEWLEEETYQTVEPTLKRRKVPFKRIKREIQSPPPRLSYKPKPQLQYETEQIVYQAPSKDEYTVFGEYVANKLRKVKLPKTRGNLQQLITTILWQAEYGMYESADAVKRVLNYSVEDKNEGTMVVIEQAPNQSTDIEEEYTVTDTN